MPKEHDKVKIRGGNRVPLRTAIAAFLFMVMPVDGKIHPKELERLLRILGDDFELPDAETEQLIADAREQTFGPGSLGDLAETVKADLARDDQLRLVSHMWEMVLADDLVHESELLLVDRVGTLLEIPAEEVAAAMTT